MFVVLWELAEILWTLGKNGPLYSLLSAYKGAHKISSIYWVYGLYKGFIKLYQKLSISLMDVTHLNTATYYVCRVPFNIPTSNISLFFFLVLYMLRLMTGL